MTLTRAAGGTQAVETYRVRAYNTAHASDNKIHDDGVARRFGFSGGLVPGVDVYAYMMHMPVARWGRAFLERGAAQCRFSRPVYDGEIAELSARDGGDAMALEVSSQGNLCASGSARLPELAAAAPAIGRFPAGDPPAREQRADAAPESLPAGACLNSSARHVSSEFAAQYLVDVRENEALYSREGLVHPGLLLRTCNDALVQNVRLGPWIHVGSQVQHLGIAHVGETLRARSRVTANYERKGHLFVELDVLVLSEGTRPVARVLHTAIYRPRQVGSG